MSRFKRPESRTFKLLQRSSRAWCFTSIAVCLSFLILWICVSKADALANMTDVQCQLILLEFKKTFVQPGEGNPLIENCDNRIMNLMWTQQVVRVYSATNANIDTYEQLRFLPDEQFAKLVVNAAAGSLLDTTQTASDDAMIRIRINSDGHFRRYVLNDTSRITSLQTMLVISIVTLAITWWKLVTGYHISKHQ